MFGLRAFVRLAVGDPSHTALESNIKHPDLGTAEGPEPVGPQQFVAPKALISQ